MMNGSQDPRQDYPGNAASQGAPPQYGAPQYAAAPQSSVWSRPVSELGVDARLMSDPRRKSPLLAMILSAMPGLGQVYVGYYNQGFVNMVVCGGTIFLLSVSGHHYSDALRAFQPFLGFFLAFYWLYNMVDAYRRATFYNQALAGLGPVEFPEDMKLPKAQGSMAGGVALILIGLLLFANTALGMSLDWLEQWWPMGLVLLGAWLVYRSVFEKRAAGAPARGQAVESSERS
jgi:TM2 domain-containing membrane protein YozV